MSGFEEWIESNYDEPEWGEGWTRRDIENAWDHQQDRIKELTEALLKADKLLNSLWGIRVRRDSSISGEKIEKLRKEMAPFLERLK